MKFKRISTRMTLSILPIILVALIALTAISLTNSKNIINKQTSEKMSYILKANDGAMGHYLNSIEGMASTLASSVESSFSTIGLSMYERMLAKVIPENEVVIGSGLWFEPYSIYSSKEYVSSYVYKNGENIEVTYDYSTPEYNYFEQDYYKRAKATTASSIFTDPYYDPVSDTYMATCAAPIIVNDKYIGCVTVDINLGTIRELIEGIQFGETGRAILTTADGFYIAGVDAEKTKGHFNIVDDEIASLASAGKEIVANKEGETSYRENGKKMNLYYSSLSQTGWRLILVMSDKELNKPLARLSLMLLVISLIAIVASTAAVVFQVRFMARRIKNVRNLVGALAEGDYSVPQIPVVADDEIGQMNTHINNMYNTSREDIDRIKRNARRAYDSSLLLRESSENLDREFHEIISFMEEVNAEMESTSASTEEVNASTEEVLSNVNILAEHTAESMKVAYEIRERAASISKSSKASFDSATALSVQFEKNLQTSIENAKVVESIGELADAISKIAGKINLLSLNASIEAARAGEAGKGFAVVATEIGALAASTRETVEKIQGTIIAVKDSFYSLTEDAKGLLGFVQGTVAPDYSKFVNVAEQYGKDAESINETAKILSEMASTIRHIMSDTTIAIQSIADAVQTTTALSSNIMNSVSSVSESVTNVSDMTDKQDKIVRSLTSIVDKYKVD